MKLPREISLAELAAVTDGKVEGPGDLKVRSVALSPLNAGEGDLAVIFDSKLVKRINECKASAVIVPEGVQSHHPKVVVQRPLLALAKMLFFAKPKQYLPEKGVHPTAIVDPTVELGKDVAIGPYVVIGPKTVIGDGTKIMAGCIIGGEVKIGRQCLFYPNCIIADYIQIGTRVILQQGASLGSDGFGYVTERMSNLEKRMAGRTDLSNDPNPHIKIPQIGTIIVEDDVEIGSYATIDRATMGATVIGQGCKIDNQVMIAHNVTLGKEVIVVSHSGVAGSSVVGDRVIIAGHVGVKDHVKIGNDAVVEGMAGVMKNVPEGDVQVGAPSQPVRDFMTQVVLTRRLPQIYDDVKDMKKRIAQLEAALNERQLVSTKEG